MQQEYKINYEELNMATEPFIGTLTAFGGTFTIENWGMCWGQMQAISENTALFSLFGAMYGGDARTTFALPDLRGRSPVGQGQMRGGHDYRQGIMMGTERISLATSQMPAHSHTAIFTPWGGGSPIAAKLEVATNGGTSTTPSTSTYLAAGSTSDNYVAPGLGGVDLVDIPGLTVTGGGSEGGTVTVGATGGSEPIGIINPLLPLNWLVALQGIYPSRS